MSPKARYLFAGDRAVVIEFGNKISKEINTLLRKLYQCISKARIEGVEEYVPTYRSLIVYYNPFKITPKNLLEKLQELENSITEITLPKALITEIPTLYGGEYGPDLEFVAHYNNLTVKEVIRIHSEKEYFIYMLGFLPGFVYLGGMSEKIATPRLEKPRLKVWESSVGIAAKQTGIYPIDSPGGWQIIGRTPVKIYDHRKEFPILLKSGDYIKFFPISREQYEDIKEKVDRGDYSCQVRTYEGI